MGQGNGRGNSRRGTSVKWCRWIKRGFWYEERRTEISGGEGDVYGHSFKIMGVNPPCIFTLASVL